MFETLSGRLSGILDTLTRRGSLSENDVTTAMREIRRALLEADVALEVVRQFVEVIKEKAVGSSVIKSVTPGQMVIKIVHDELVQVLGSESQSIDLSYSPPVPILMVGLQGSGKTTSTAKIAKRLTDRDKKKVLMVSLDTQRPAAQEQLKVLGEQINIATLPVISGQTPIQIAKRAMDTAKLGSFDIAIIDTAGRMTVDNDLMQEIVEIKSCIKPKETLLVADSLTGQDAVNTAKSFESHIGITGIMLTRIDGDGRGGAALSMRAITDRPIKLLGTGEKWDDIEDFHPKRMASRILGMGDVVSLVERASETIDALEAKKIATKIKKGIFDLNDLAGQLKQMQQLGGMTGVLGMMPGISKIKSQIADANLDDNLLKRQHAIISSMTKEERVNSKIINGKRRRRIALGSGTKVQDVNKLLKTHRQMADMMKKMGKDKSMLGQMVDKLGLNSSPIPTNTSSTHSGILSGIAKAENSLSVKTLSGLPSHGGKEKHSSNIGYGKLPGLGGASLKSSTSGYKDLFSRFSNNIKKKGN
ncbi:MAG: signal recognition particle protein [Hyphomicrobiaceae bacterium]|nr:signal recognition particle protein [Hyphomicrobiaceae bacterium]